jgi:hypothetical protein
MGTSGSFKILELGLEVLLKIWAKGLVPLGKPTYIFTLKWMKSQSLSHTMCVMSQRPSSPRKAHTYSYIEMDEIHKVYLTQCVSWAKGLVPLGKPTYIFYIEMDEITMCVLSQRPTTVLGWWPITMECSQRFSSSSSATLVPGNFLWVLYHQSIYMHEVPSKLLMQTFLSLFSWFFWCKRPGISALVNNLNKLAGWHFTTRLSNLAESLNPNLL